VAEETVENDAAVLVRDSERSTVSDGFDGDISTGPVKEYTPVSLTSNMGFGTLKISVSSPSDPGGTIG
jgi:hypothetical protein